ncbi:hypothetical protein ACQP1W_38785 [Spirillospora sp. CA-255316]
MSRRGERMGRGRGRGWRPGPGAWRWVWRSAVVALGLAVMAAALVGPVAKVTADRSASYSGAPSAGTSGAVPSAARSAVREPMPTLSRERVRAAVVSPEAAGGFRRVPLQRDPVGFIQDRTGVAGCYSRGVEIPGRVLEIGGIRAVPGARIRDGYAVQAVAYGSAAEARRAMGVLRARARACPVKSRYPRTPMGRRTYAIGHDLAWRVTGDRTGPDWSMVRGVERKSYGKGWREPTEVIRTTDYMQRGNVLLIQTLHLWGHSGRSEGPVMREAAGLLDRTVAGLGGPPCTWTARYLACEVAGG